MNFQTHFVDGINGRNIGRTTGISALDKAIGGIHRKSIVAIGAEPKVGKTTLADFCYVLSPYEEALHNSAINADINTLETVDWIYWSFEIDRVSKEFKYCAHYMEKDFGISEFEYNGVIYEMSSEYLEGKKIGNDYRLIPVQAEHIPLVKIIYETRIIPLFGEYDVNGNKVRQGKIDFIEERENPTGLRNYLIKLAKQRGTFLEERYETTDDDGKKIFKNRIVGWRPLPQYVNHTVIVITDHVRKLKAERGYQMKQIVDKYVEYQVELRNLCGFFTFVDICHINRSLGAIDNIKHAGEVLYPTGDHFKDTGNLSEDANIVLTMFNPLDEKYNLEKHFGANLQYHPKYRSIHVVSSRNTACPLHIQVNMHGGTNNFTPLNAEPAGISGGYGMSAA